MNGSPVDSLPRRRARERVVLQVDSLAARCIGAVALLGGACWLIVILARAHHHPGLHHSGRVGWSLTVLAAVALLARGIFLGRPVTTVHAGAAGASRWWDAASDGWSCGTTQQWSDNCRGPCR